MKKDFFNIMWKINPMFSLAIIIGVISLGDAFFNRSLEQATTSILLIIMCLLFIVVTQLQIIIDKL